MPIDFPVDALSKMKADHEQQHSTEATTISDALLQKLIDQIRSTPTVTLSGGDQSIVSCGNVSVVSIGLTYSDARQIALDVYKVNALELRGIAESVARQRAEEVSNKFLEKLASESVSPEALSDPDMQHALFAAQKAAARSSNPDLQSVLVDLLVDRAKAQSDDLMRLVINEAIEVSARLTVDQFDALSVIFVTRYTRNFGVRSIEGYVKYFETTIKPFLSSASRTDARYQHLQYCGCGARDIMPQSLELLVAAAYPHLFCQNIPRAGLLQSLDNNSDLADAMRGNMLRTGDDESTMALLPVFDFEFEPFLKAQGATENVIDSFKKYVAQLASNELSAATLQKIHEGMPEYLKYWARYGGAFSLTTVGIAIAHANIRRKNIGDFDLKIWIN